MSTSLKHICGYCQSEIKSNDAGKICIHCSSHYHIDCWEENHGCAAYGCSQKKDSNELSSNHLITSAEYFINIKKYEEAITECSRLLKIEPENISAKRLYNKAVSLANNKIKLNDLAEQSIQNSDFTGASIYLEKLLPYTNEDDRPFIEAKLQAALNAGPIVRKKRLYSGIITTASVIIILGLMVWLGYYFYVLKEERAFAEIQRTENINDIEGIEKTISSYELFSKKYKKGEFVDQSNDKISRLSYLLAQHYSDKNWRTAKQFADKINKDTTPLAYKEVYEKLHMTAYKEYYDFVTKARKLDKLKKFPEAQLQIEEAIRIAEEFNWEGKFDKKLVSSLDLMKKKIQTFLKYTNITKEINEKEKELKTIPAVNTSYQTLDLSIESSLKSGIYRAFDASSGRTIAVKSFKIPLSPGEFVTARCVYNGTISGDTLTNEQFDLYTITGYDDGMASSMAGNYQRESVIQRLTYLKDEKNRIDSLLSVKF